MPSNCSIAPFLPENSLRKLAKSFSVASSGPGSSATDRVESVAMDEVRPVGVDGTDRRTPPRTVVSDCIDGGFVG